MSLSNFSSPPLQGVRIWLSGSIAGDIPGPQQNAMCAFVEKFADLVFRSGGHILHGCHPTITPILLKAAKRHVVNNGRRDALTLAVSRHWSKTESAQTLEEWRRFSVLYETPESTEGNARENSLKILREWMAERCDAFVSLGGDLQRLTENISGIPIEAALAINRSLPCFVLGGLGGTAEEMLKRHADLLGKLRNGLDQETNVKLALNADADDLATTIHNQLARLPVVHGRVSDGMSFRILALDGGGVKGAFTAAFLAELEKDLKKPLSQYFDLIAGTSTGGILALGLSLGISAEDLLTFYVEKGPTIFPMTNVFGRVRRQFWQLFFGPKHRGDALSAAISAAYFPDGTIKTMRDSNCRLVIPSYNTVGGQHHIFRTPHNKLQGHDADKNMAQVARASAAAPTYFSASDVADGFVPSNHLDGGVWANCPAMAAIVEATTYLDVPLQRIDLLSIGTTKEPFNATRFKESSVAGWNKNLITLLMDAQVNSAVDHAENLVGKARFLRIDQTTEQGRFTLDDSKRILELANLGRQKARDYEIQSQIKSRFLNGVIATDWKSGTL